MSKQKLNELIEKYKSTYTVPKHPKLCPLPKCGNKIIVYNMSHWDAVFMCSNNNCLWPLQTHSREQTFGKNDVQTYVKIRHEERKISIKTGEKLETSFESLWNLDEKDVSPVKSITSCDLSKKRSHKKKREVSKGSIDTNTFDNSGKVIDRKKKCFLLQN